VTRPPDPPTPGVFAPDWPAPPGVRALMTTRQGGTSPPPWDSLNLGVAVGDDPARVIVNRSLLRGLLPQEPRWLRQVHGRAVVHADGVPAHAPPEADAAWTATAGVVCCVQVADCLPVLLAARDGSAVGAAHAGWRGLAAGVIEATVSAMPGPPSGLLAWLGPAIGPAAFEVGEEVLAAFTRGDPDSAAAFAPSGPGKWLADLFALARRRLHAAGVAAVHGGGLCTVADGQRFFSHRRDRPGGRMAALVWIEEKA
jgi:YfiH family protein